MNIFLTTTLNTKILIHKDNTLLFLNIIAGIIKKFKSK